MNRLTFRFTLLLALSLVCLNAIAQEREITQIKVVSLWGGLGKPEHDELLITRKPGGYFANGKKVQDQLVKNFRERKPILGNAMVTKCTTNDCQGILTDTNTIYAYLLERAEDMLTYAAQC